LSVVSFTKAAKLFHGCKATQYNRQIMDLISPDVKEEHVEEEHVEEQHIEEQHIEEEQEGPNLAEDKREYLVYCVVSKVHPNQTYIGVTNNWTRRIRQHNGFIKGGARRTTGHRPWITLFHVRGLTHIEALQLEWALKHRRQKGYSGPRGRIVTLEFLLFSGKVKQWTKRAPLLTTLQKTPLSFHCTWSQEKWVSLCHKDDLPLKNVHHCTRHYESDIFTPSK
jgi:predicted GIY-YIG superfamily endonuclease